MAQRGRKPSYTKAHIEEAIRLCKGNLVRAAAFLTEKKIYNQRCTTAVFYNALKRWPELQEVLEQSRRDSAAEANSVGEDILNVYAQMSSDAKSGLRLYDHKLASLALREAKFRRETWGKSDGWTRRLEVTGIDGEALMKDNLDPRIYAILQSRGETPKSILTNLLKLANDEYENELDMAKTNS